MTQEAGTPPGFWERVEQIAERAVARAMRSGPLRNASISDGGLTIRGGFLRLLAGLAGVELFYVGPSGDVLGNGTWQQVWVVRRADGTVVLDLQDAFPDPDGTLNQALNWRDRAGNVILADDTNAGQGIARPWVPLVFYPARNGDWPVITDTSFQTVYRARAAKQQPRLVVRVWGINDTAGATGEIKVVVNGTQLGSTVATSNSMVTEYTFGPLDVAGAHMATLVVEVQARMTSGTGGVQVGISQVQGQQS